MYWHSLHLSTQGTNQITKGNQTKQKQTNNNKKQQTKQKNKQMNKQ